jgi:dipeptidyl-peptidase-2
MAVFTSTTVLVVLGSLLPAINEVSAHDQSYPYEEKYITQFVDHFNYRDERIYAERYLLTNTFFKEGETNILFFYTGNEGPIEEFFDNSGFVFEFAKEVGALVVFGEHRYYGKSLPLGEESFKLENIGYLSVEQALGDFAVLVKEIRRSYKIAKVVSFGGSYGGMLTAYFRFKYPNLVDAALAASAPIYLIAGESSPFGFYEIVTKDLEMTNKECPLLVKKALSQVLQLAEEGTAGLEHITKSFQLCRTLTKDKVEHLLGWVRNSFAQLAMVDYPYPASFLAPLPAYPMKVSCSYLLDNREGDVMRGLAMAVGLFYNGTGGNLTCYDIEKEFIECADPTGCGVGPDAMAWDFQACTEMDMNISTNSVTDMFPPTKYDSTEYCKKTWGVQKRPEWFGTSMWGKDIKSTSYIIFSNGVLDPWSYGGVLHSPSESIVAILIEGAAHHLDLRGTNPADPPAVTAAREQEKALIKQWIL